MHIRILGAHNIETANTRLAGVLLDGTIALDCGSVASSLTLAEQRRIRAVLLTHRHYDHLRDLPLLCLATLDQDDAIDLYASEETCAALEDHVLGGGLYPDFRVRPTAERPRLRVRRIAPLEPFSVGGYAVLPVPVPHGAPAVAYALTTPTGQTLCYTGDTTRGLASAWEHVAPDLLITEVTWPNAAEAQALESGHMTPALLAGELVPLLKRRDGSPRVVATHMHPAHEETIRRELSEIARSLGVEIAPAHEGMELEL